MKILVSAHDAGGANLVLSKYVDSRDATFLLTGPAAYIADQIGIRYNTRFEMGSLENIDLVVIGSNSQPRISDLVFEEARLRGIRSIGILDHWVNYRTRWSKSPDIVEVQDIRAYIGAVLTYGFKVRLHINHYLKNISQEYFKVSDSEKGLLIIVQPLPFGSWGIHGSSCLCDSVDFFRVLHPEIRQVTVRPHFDSSVEVCSNYLNTKLDLNCLVSSPREPLAVDVSNNRYVIGYDSYAMFVAKKLGSRVFTISKKRRSWFAPRYRLLKYT